VHAFHETRATDASTSNLAALRGTGARLGVRLAVRSGADRIAYFGVRPDLPKWDANWPFNNSISTAGNDADLLYPFTTTLIEVRFNREPCRATGQTASCGSSMTRRLTTSYRKD